MTREQRIDQLLKQLEGLGAKVLTMVIDGKAVDLTPMQGGPEDFSQTVDAWMDGWVEQQRRTQTEASMAYFVEAAGLVPRHYYHAGISPEIDEQVWAKTVQHKRLAHLGGGNRSAFVVDVDNPRVGWDISAVRREDLQVFDREAFLKRLKEWTSFYAYSLATDLRGKASGINMPWVPRQHH